jgi:lipid A 4'-phosphatase
LKPLTILNLSFPAAVALFALAPSIDIRVSDLFYSPQDGFWLAHDPFWMMWREIFRFAGNVIGLIGLALWALWRMIGPARRIAPRIWGYTFLLMALGPGVAVNLVLKPLWARARPADVSVFGGAKAFTPALLPTDQCSLGCSFVSGEAAAAFGVSIIVGLLLWPSLGRRGRLWAVLGLGAYALVVSGLRVAMGRHYLSDAVFGGFVTAYTAVALFRLLKIGAALPDFGAGALAADARALAQRLGRRARG